MIKLYYTTNKGQDEVQTRTDLSLGGFKSSTVIPNSSYNNLLGDVSLLSIRNKSDEFIAVIAKNEGDSIQNVRMWFEYPENPVKTLEVAVISLTQEGSMEIIPNPFSRPYYAEFHSADGESNSVDIGDFDSGEMVGVWIKASINVTNFKQPYTDESIEMNGNPAEVDEEIKIIFEWD